jgi:hypothetical protein
VKFLGNIKSNFNKLLSISLEWEHEKSFLVYFLPKLAYGFVSKHPNIIEKTVYLYLEFFKRTGLYYNKHLDYDSEDSQENSQHDAGNNSKTNNLQGNSSTSKTKSSDPQTSSPNPIFGTGRPQGPKSNDKKLEAWIFSSNFLELTFHGMEKLGNYDQEFINIILLTGKANLNQILTQLVANPQYSSQGHLCLIERVFLVTLNTGHSVFERIIPCIDKALLMLINNIVQGKQRPLSLKIFLSFLTNVYVRLDLVNISKVQTGQVIKALLGIFKKKYDVYLIPILLHCLRFLSQLFITQDKIVNVKSISELNCPIIEEFLLAADQ